MSNRFYSGFNKVPSFKSAHFFLTVLMERTARRLRKEKRKIKGKATDWRDMLSEPLRENKEAERKEGEKEHKKVDAPKFREMMDWVVATGLIDIWTRDMGLHTTWNTFKIEVPLEDSRMVYMMSFEEFAIRLKLKS